MENNKSFRDSMNRLDEIVAQLERNDIELEEAVKLFEEGLVLVKDCDNQLNNFENKVKKLLESFQGEEND